VGPNMRVPNARQISIGRAYDTDARDLPPVRALFLDQSRKRLLRGSFDRRGVLSHRSLRLLPGQIHHLVIRLRGAWDFRIYEPDFSF